MKENEQKTVILTKRTRSEDIECLLLARLGFSYRLIGERTGLSLGQVGLRLRKLGISVRDYRNGENEIAKQVVLLADRQSEVFFDELKGQLQKQLNTGGAA